MRPLDARVWSHVRPARGWLTVVVAAGIGQTLLVVAQAFVVAGAVVAVATDTSTRAWAIAVVAVMTLRAATTFLADVAAARAAAVVGTTLRHRILERLLADDPTSSRPAGATTMLALRGVAQTKPYLTRYLPAALLAATLPPISILAITVADPLSGLIVLATIPLVPLFAALVGARTKDRAGRQWRELGSLAGHFVDVVRGLPTLVVFRRAERQTAVIRQITHRYRRATVETLRLAFASSAVLELIATLSVALVAVDVGVRLAAGHLGLGTALFVLLLAPEAYWPVRRAGAEFHAAAEGTAAFADADALLTAEQGDSVERGTEPVGPVADIEVSNVSVDWQDEAPPGLAPLSARLRAPGLVAVQGPSGAGKTTFLGVLQGRIPPTAGEVRVNGLRLSDCSPAWWREHVAWLPQRPVFVRGTVGDNLRLGGPGAGDGDLWNALSAVGLRDRVASMNGGLDAGLQQDGANLSAGERARLALARILVADRPIVLLDEPSAHLDLETERRIAEVIVDISRRALVVVVTHRDTLASYADHVIELGQTCTLEPAPTAAWPCRDHGDGSAPLPSHAVPDDAEEPVPASGRGRQVLAVMLGSLASLSGVALTATAGWLIVTASSQPPVLALLVAIVAVRTFGIARPVLRYLERLWSHDVALRLLADRRAAVYAALVPLTPGQLGRRRGELLGNVVDDVEAHVDRRLRFQLPLATMLCAGTVAAALVTLVAPSAGLVDLGLLLAAGMGVFALVRSAVERTDLALTRAGVQLGDEVTGLVEARDELRSWDAQDRALEATAATGSQFERLARRIAVVTGLGRAVAGGVAGLAVAATLTIVAPLVGTGQVTAAMAGLLVLVPLALFDLVQTAADAAGWEVRTRHALDRLRVITDRPPLVADPARPLPWPGGHADVALRQVSAGWGDTVALAGINAQWRPGARVAVIGPSGSGKSTLAALLVRFLDPTAGQVVYGDVALQHARIGEVRTSIGLLDDDPHIFATTVAENLRFAAPGASDELLRRGLTAAGLADWLEELPDGLHTWIGDGHRPVSGGERARLGIARIIVSGLPVVVLDEPTAHLDAATARHVTESVVRGAGDRTVIVISHRPEDVEIADHVLDLTPAVASSAGQVRTETVRLDGAVAR